MCGLAFVSTVLLVVAYYVQTARSRILADPLRPAMAALPFAQLRANSVPAVLHQLEERERFASTLKQLGETRLVHGEPPIVLRTRTRCANLRDNRFDRAARVIDFLQTDERPARKRTVKMRQLNIAASTFVLVL